ncbi:hypothetical protein, partial [Yersinia wautersii]|uniref:hypothetical protein n=1 Tax=Yersinia wautersii TaxID=1341643 RepID=UPI001EE1EF24
IFRSGNSDFTAQASPPLHTKLIHCDHSWLLSNLVVEFEFAARLSHCLLLTVNDYHSKLPSQ